MMSLSTKQPISYSSIQYLASIIKEEKATEDVPLNPPAKEPLIQKDREKLIFSDVHTFICHVNEVPDKVYDSIMRLWKHLVLIDKQSRKSEKKFTNYKKAKEVYIIKNKQLQSENRDLENQLAHLEKQLEIACSDKHFTPLFPPSPVSSPFLALVVSDNSDDNLR